VTISFNASLNQAEEGEPHNLTELTETHEHKLKYRPSENKWHFCN